MDDAGTETEVGSGGGGSAITEYSFKPGDFYYPASNPAVLDTDSGSNGTIKRHLFDDSTDEVIEGVFVLPGTVNSGDVTFEIYGYPVTAAAAPNNQVVMDVSHSARANGETWDSSYTNEGSGTLTCQTTQDLISRFTWTETVANLGWSANEQVRFKVTRTTADAADTLSGDFALTHFRIILP